MKRILLSMVSALMICGGAFASATANALANGKANKKELWELPRYMDSSRSLRSKSVKPKAVTYPEVSGNWTEWEQFGTGTLFISDMIDFTEEIEGYEGETPEITVDVRYDSENASIAQFRFNKIFNDADIVVTYYEDEDGLLKMKPQSTGIEAWGDNVLVMDFASAYEQIDPADLDMTQEEMDEVIAEYDTYNYFIPTLGRFYIFLGFMLESMPDDAVAMADMQFQLDGYSTFEPQFTGESFFNPGEGSIGITLEEGVAMVRYGFFEGLADQTSLMAVLNGEEGISTITASGEIKIPEGTVNSVRNITAITFDADGQALEWGSKVFTVVDDEEDKWESLGETEFVSEIFEGFLIENPEPSRYKVELQESKATPGLYRLVNAFGAKYPYNEEGEYNTATNNYLIINASDPQMVLIPLQLLGMNWGGGEFALWSDAAYELDFGAKPSEVLDIAGKLEGNKITFPRQGLLLWCPDWEVFGGENGSIYMTNYEGLTSITIPESGVNSISADDATSVFYNLQGLKIENPAAGDLVIERKGNVVRKVMVK